VLIIVLLKGVPARTTRVVEVGGVLNREAMDIVLNPHDSKAVEAADFVKRRVGGKVVALSMGPDIKLVPIMRPLFDAEVSGVDEEYVLSDRKMAGSDTLATSYAVSLGVKKVVERHTGAIDEIIEAVKKEGYSDAIRGKAATFYGTNLLPNGVYSTLPAVRNTLIQRFLDGKLTVADATAELEKVRSSLKKFIVLSGVKTTDGETGSVGPQVSEGLSQSLGVMVPHATYVEDFDVDPASQTIEASRRLGYLLQTVEMRLPALLTLSESYRPRENKASIQEEVRLNNYRGKVLEAFRWNATDLAADPRRLGLSGSPTIVGPGIDIGKPPVQKILGRSRVFTKRFEASDIDGQRLGPFDKGDLADGLPGALAEKLEAEGTIAPFDYRRFLEDLFP